MPIPIDKLRSIKHLITHKDCADGIAAAMIIKDVLPDVKVSFQHYDDPQHMSHVPEEGALFCDFSPFYPKPPKDDASDEDKAEYAKLRDLAEQRIMAWIEMGAIVLDHHRSQKAVVERFGELGVFADEHKEPGVCGATLAFREVWQHLAKDDLQEVMEGENVRMKPEQWREYRAAVEDFAVLSGIRDTWQKTNPRFRDACEQAEAIRFWGADDLVGLPVAEWGPKLDHMGTTLFRKKLENAQKAIDKGWRFTLKNGRRVIVFEGLAETSDAAELLGEEVDFLVGFGFTCEEGKPRMVFSTRSHTDFNCEKFCTAQGGGGHLRAAGFPVVKFDPMTTANPYAYIHDLLTKWDEDAPVPTQAEIIQAALKDKP